MWNTPEIVSYKNVSTTQGPFTLRGGNYSIEAHATWGGGSVTLQRLAADGSTYVTVGAFSAFTADGTQNGNLPGGTYQFLVATATAIYVDLASVVTTL